MADVNATSGTSRVNGAPDPAQTQQTQSPPPPQQQPSAPPDATATHEAAMAESGIGNEVNTQA